MAVNCLMTTARLAPGCFLICSFLRQGEGGADEVVHLLQGVEAGDGHLVAHGARQGVRHPGEQLCVAAAAFLKLRQAQPVVVLVPASGVDAVGMGAVIGVAQLIEGHHVRPDLVYVGALAEVQHVRREASGGTHVDLQGHDVSPFAKALLALRQPEELQVEKAAGGAEGLQCGLARRLHVGGDLLVHIIVSGHALVHHVHDGVAGDVASGEQPLAPGVAHAVVGGDHAGDVFLHQVGHRRQLIEKGHGVLVALELPGGDGAHAVVRLHDDGIAHLMGEGQGGIQRGDRAAAGAGDARLAVVLLHGELALVFFDLMGLQAGGDVEIRPQLGVQLQPVFVVALHPVEFEYTQL